jgi:hypothetical protein
VIGKRFYYFGIFLILNELLIFGGEVFMAEKYLAADSNTVF